MIANNIKTLKIVIQRLQKKFTTQFQRLVFSGKQ